MSFSPSNGNVCLFCWRHFDMGSVNKVNCCINCFQVSDAWNRISNNMGIPVEDLKKKKETLMTAFRTNLKKKKESIRSGAGLDDIYTPSWPFFEIMESFLRDVYECKSIINTDGGVSK